MEFVLALLALVLVGLATPALLLVGLIDPDALSWRDLRGRVRARWALRGVENAHDVAARSARP